MRHQTAWRLILAAGTLGAGGKYVMMFEIGEPKEQAGVPFTARFATSTDLKHWTVTPQEAVYEGTLADFLRGWFPERRGR